MTGELRRRFPLSDEQVEQIRAWHREYEAADDLDACFRGFGALLAEKDRLIARLRNQIMEESAALAEEQAFHGELVRELAEERAAHDATNRRAERWQAVALGVEARVVAEIRSWLEAHH